MAQSVVYSALESDRAVGLCTLAQALWNLLTGNRVATRRSEVYNPRSVMPATKSVVLHCSIIIDHTK